MARWAAVVGEVMVTPGRHHLIFRHRHDSRFHSHRHGLARAFVSGMRAMAEATGAMTSYEPRMEISARRFYSIRAAAICAAGGEA